MDSGAAERVILAEGIKRRDHIRQSPGYPEPPAPTMSGSSSGYPSWRIFLNVPVDTGYEENPCNFTTKDQIFPNKNYFWRRKMHCLRLIASFIWETPRVRGLDWFRYSQLSLHSHFNKSTSLFWHAHQIFALRNREVIKTETRLCGLYLCSQGGRIAEHVPAANICNRKSWDRKQFLILLFQKTAVSQDSKSGESW